MDELKDGVWAAKSEGSTTRGLVPLEKIRIGGTFQLEGEQWRKFEAGIRRQVGRAPKQLRQLDPSTLVWEGI